MKKICKVPGCGYFAHWYPVLLIYPPTIKGHPAQCLLKVPICHKHKGRTNFRMQDFVTPKGWSDMVAQFIKNGYAVPDEKRTKIIFVPIEDADIAAEAQFGRTKEAKYE